MDFRVVPSTVPASVADWISARETPAAELPALTPDQLEQARQLLIPEEDYKRFRVLLRQRVLDRQMEEGRAFGHLVERILEPLGPTYELQSVGRRGAPLGWRVSIRAADRGVFEFQTPFDVVQALLEGSASEEEIEGFRRDLYDAIEVYGTLGATG